MMQDIDPTYGLLAGNGKSLPRRVTPRVLDDLHSLLDAHESTRRVLDWQGWDRGAQRHQDDATRVANRASVVKRRGKLGMAGPLAFRHSGWRKDRERVIEAVRAVEGPRSHYLRLDACGRRVVICAVRDQPGKYIAVGNYCRSRWCVPCGNARAAKLSRLWQDKLKTRDLRFVTLTLKTDNTSLRDATTRLYKCYRNLQRSRLWDGCVDGSVAFYETKYNHKRQRWHPHLHIICSGRYLSQRALSNKWLAITGDSYIVDVRRVQRVDDALSYITKYATKPGLSTIVNHPHLLQEAIKSLRGLRMMIRYGDFRDFVLDDDACDVDLVPVMTLGDLLTGYRLGQSTATAILASLMHCRIDEWSSVPDD